MMSEAEKKPAAAAPGPLDRHAGVDRATAERLRRGRTPVEAVLDLHGFTEEQAQMEASRCLQCWINTIFEGNEEEGTECILCGGCVDVCPENCLTLVPLSQFHFSEETRNRLETEAASYPNALQHLAPGDLPGGEGSVMVKDETICIRCGLCAERCPAHTITMEAYETFGYDPDQTPIDKVLQTR